MSLHHLCPSGRLRAAGILLCITAALHEAGAQRVTSAVDLQTTRLQYADTVDATAAGISPSLRLDWDRAMLGAWGTYAQLGHAWSADGSVGASLFTPSAGPLSAELASTLGGSTHQDGTRTGSAIALGRVHLDAARAGAWIGGGGGSTWDGRTWRALREGDFGAWLSNGPASLTITAEPTVVDDTIRYADLGAEASLRTGIFELGAVAGTRAGSRLPALASNPTTWGSVSATAWLFPRVALLASAGTYPVDYTQGFPGGKFASVGVRIALSRRTSETLAESPLGAAPASEDVTSFDIASGARGVRTFRVHAPGARTVEISGDFTQWQPRRLTPAGNGWYTIAMPIASGTYQMNMRVNAGPWLVPPSLTSVRDEFGASTGLLVLP